eukprot:Nitzschia sp. Nitz4//scaffold185_size43419//13011//13772//NITZ4_007298-RA/size43419-processed-gene-0.79-mRNA-1//-1//CDS//3329539700//5741//frame0
MSDSNNSNTTSNTVASPPNLSAYWDNAAKGVALSLWNLSTTWYHPNEAIRFQYQTERQQLEKYITPLRYGVYGTLFMFLGFRFTSMRSSSMAAAKAMQKKASSSAASSSAAATTASKATPPPPPPTLSYLEQKQMKLREQHSVYWNILMDFLLSLSVGVSGGLLMFSQHIQDVRSDVEMAPLVAGRSVVADHVCPLFEIEQDVNGGIASAATEVASPDATTFARFVQNCQRRQQLESQLQQMGQLPPDQHVSL